MDIIECLECGKSISVELAQEKQKVSCPECMVGLTAHKADGKVNVEYAEGFGGIDGHPNKDPGYEDSSFGKYD